MQMTGEEVKTSVSVESLAVSYGGPTTLEDISFTVRPGTSVGVIGPNGCGKTTLFKVLLGTLEPLTGHFSVSGRIAYVPQHDSSRHDFPISALEVALMGRFSSVPWWKSLKGKPTDEANRALESLGVGDIATKQYGDLSGGQRQRVLIARALVQEADVLLLDEPFSNIDPASVDIILEIVNRLRNQGRTIMVTTHDIEQARIWDQVLCLNRKQIAFGQPACVLTPKTLKETYGRELIVIDQDSGQQAISVQHHDHD